jgi:O-antigen/teichoic acid export membrane protein
VKKYFTPLETGLYSSWSLFAKILFYLVGPIIQVVFVFFAENRKQKLQEQVLLISLGILLFVGVAGYIGYAFFGRFFILILFGNKYLSLLPYLGLAALFGSLYSALNFLNSYFLAKKSRFALILFFSLPLYWLLLNIF